MAESPEEITVTVAETASDALGTPIEELPPLSEAIDLEGLEAVVARPTEGRSSCVTVSFSYAGLRVLVRSGHTVFVQPISDRNEEAPDRTHP